MLIPLSKLYAKYRIKSKGVLHIGAHWGEEFHEYTRFGMTNQIWVEADPDTYKTLVNKIGGYSGVHCVNACISDVNGEEVTFNVSNNDGQSSSILEFGTHAQVHPEVKYVRSFTTTTRRLDDMFTGLSGINFLACDCQGNELKVLKGMGSLLDGIQYAYLEVNKKETYQGCALVEEIDAFLMDFRRVETADWVGDTWTDAFYIRK